MVNGVGRKSEVVESAHASVAPSSTDVGALQEELSRSRSELRQKYETLMVSDELASLAAGGVSPTQSQHMYISSQTTMLRQVFSSNTQLLDIWPITKPTLATTSLTPPTVIRYSLVGKSTTSDLALEPLC